MISFDGQIYEREEDVPDLGSLRCVNADGNRRHYQGLTKDAWKLPKYKDLGTGSTFEAMDSTLEKRYEATTKTWYIKDGTAETYVEMEGDLQPITQDEFQEFFENDGDDSDNSNENFGGNIDFDDILNG